MQVSLLRFTMQFFPEEYSNIIHLNIYCDTFKIDFFYIYQFNCHTKIFFLVFCVLMIKIKEMKDEKKLF